MAMPATRRYRTDAHDSARWRGFPWRPGDIVISPPPKCGTTWVQMICALLVFQTPALDRALDLISPRLDSLTVAADEALGILEAQEHRRFVKTHTPLDGLPYDEVATYICIGRDPRDVALSWDNHLANTDMAAFERARRAVGAGSGDRAGGDHGQSRLPPMWAENRRKRFWRWAEDPTPPDRADSSLRSTLHHLQTFWAARERPNVVLLHYGELKADLEGQMRALARRLSIAVPEDRWPELVQAAGFGRMRERADQLVPNASRGVFRENQRFFARGTVGQWREVLDEDDVARYHRRLAELAGSCEARGRAAGGGVTDPYLAGWDPVGADLVAWAHRP